ncbi:MAG TPA: tetratricopeptide repeat protein [Longimicrobiales bacterium]|nr:tetratricopeptide repeat protein [Longimicrobiales bacterium]
MRPGHFFTELRRRHVLRVVGAYAVAAWVMVEVYTTVQPILFPAGEDHARLVVYLLLAGFPIVFALAWIYDITPSGVRRTEALDEEHAVLALAQSAGVRRSRMLSPRATGFFGLGVLVALVSFAAYARIGPELARPEGQPISSIAVLPFTDMSEARDQQYLSDGIAEELLNRLTQVSSDLRVPARGSSFLYRDSSLDLREIGRALGVETVLEGSVRRERDHVRVAASLSDVRTGRVIWTRTFDGDAGDLFALQDSIAGAIVAELRLQVERRPEAGESGTSNRRAADAYLKGRAAWAERTDASLRSALALFRNAVAEDPEFADAHAALAQTYAVLPAFGDYPVDSAVVLGYAAASEAIRLDPKRGDAWAAMGQIVQNFEWDLSDAERNYRKALEYGNDVSTRQWLAETLILLGRYDEARTHIDAVLAADRVSAVALHVDGLLETLAGRTDDALATYRDLARVHPGFIVGLHGWAWAAAAHGRNDDAVRALDRLAAANPAHDRLYRAITAAVHDAGQRTAALAALRAAGMSPAERAAWSMVLGDVAAAKAALVESYEQHTDVTTLFLLAHPLMKPLRSDADVRAMADAIGIVLGG